MSEIETVVETAERRFRGTVIVTPDGIVERPADRPPAAPPTDPASDERRRTRNNTSPGLGVYA